MKTLLFDLMVDYFNRDEWPYDRVAGQDILQLAYRTEQLAWTCYAQTLEDDQQFLFYSVAPVKASEEKRPFVAEYITRANYGLVVGNFEMDWKTGEVRYKTSIDIEDDRLSYALWRSVVYANLFVAERYLPGLIAVVYEDVSPKTAVLQAESS